MKNNLKSKELKATTMKKLSTLKLIRIGTNFNKISILIIFIKTWCYTILGEIIICIYNYIFICFTSSLHCHDPPNYKCPLN